MKSCRTLFAVRSYRVVTPDGTIPATVIIENEFIKGIEDHELSNSQSLHTIDLGEHVLMPGLVDPHVHLNEPGRTEWEGLATGTAAASAGGITTLVDMPLNSSPVTTTPEAVEAKRSAAKGALSVDVAMWGGLVPGNAERVSELLDVGVCGLKAFLCDSGLDEFPATGEAELRAAMLILAKYGAPLLVHAEIELPSPMPNDSLNYNQYVASRPPEFERRAIELIIKLCRETQCKTHIVHLADADSLPMLAVAKSEGLPLTVETCPHYLTFASEEIADGATEFKCAPPIRDMANREGLWQGLAEGVIDFIATDHSPCPPHMKHQDTGDFVSAWGGISSLQLLLPAVWTEASKRGHTLDEVANWLSHRPALLPNVPAGISPNQPANLVEFDPNGSFIVRGVELKHRHPITPYEGRALQGVVKRTWLRGKPACKGLGRMIGGLIHG